MANDGILDAASMKLWKLEDGSLVLRYLRVHPERPAERRVERKLLGPPRRALPLSDPERWILFADSDGTEIGVLGAIDDLDEASRAVLREALKAEYTIERVLRVLEVEREPLSGQTRWRVQIAAPSDDAPIQASNSDGSQLDLAPISAPAASSGASSAVELAPAEASAEESDGEARAGALEKVASLLSLGRDKGASEVVESMVEHEFTIAGQEDVQTARYPHIFIVDTERRRYEITDCEALDVDSRKAAERFF